MIREYGLLTRLIRTRPLLTAALLYLCGCILGYALDLPLCVLLTAFSVLVVLSVPAFRFRRKFSAVFLLLAMIPAGAARFSIAWHAVDPLPEQTGAVLSGRICRSPDYREDTERTICVLEGLSIGGNAVPGHIRLYLRGDPAELQAVRLGQQVTCEAHIWQADTATNPGQFDFSNYLRVNGLSGYATAEIESARLTAPELRFSDLPERFCEAAGTYIDSMFPENAAIARAFLIGDRSMISEKDHRDYSDSGAAHLLALSGMHISLIAALFSGLLGCLMNRKYAFAVTAILLTVYGYLIGFSASLTRALMMFCIRGCAPIVGRRYDPPTSLAASMLLWLILLPLDILSASFVLSYSASAGIILLYPPLSDLLHLRSRAHQTLLAPMTRRVLRWFADLILVTAAAQIATLPAAVHYFGAQPVLSFFVNIAAVPIAMAAYVLSIFGTLLHIAPVCVLADSIFTLLTQIVRSIAAIPFSLLRIARFPLWITFFCAGTCFLASDLSAIPVRIRRFLPLAVVPAVLLSNLIAFSTTINTSVVFLDAGEADCAVVRSAGKVYLVDAGDDYSPAADYLSAMNYIPDAVFLTHAHADHVCGLDEILDVSAPKRIYISANWNAFEADESAAAVLKRAEDMGCEILILDAGDEIRIDETTYFRVLSPKAGFPGVSANEDSMILNLTHGDTSVLFLGDASAETAAKIALDTDVIKVGHHGGKGTLSKALLEAASPSMCVVSVGTNNYGHPDAETLLLADVAGVPVFRTDQSGAITCLISKDGTVRVRTYK